MNTNHEQYKEWLQLLMYDELNPVEKKSLEKHMQQCIECQTEITQLRKLHTTLQNRRFAEPTETTLFEARRELKVSLRANYKKVSMWDWFFEQTRAILFPNIRFVLSSAATLVIGFVIGYYVILPRTQTQQGQPVVQQGQTIAPNSGTELVSNNTIPPPQGDGQISNVRFIDSDMSDGQVEFQFDAVTPVRMKGNVNDPRIQKILTHALLNEQNPGVRLRSASAMEQVLMAEPSAQPPVDNTVKDALLTALRTDKNAGVRREALEALKRFPLDDEIKRALLRVLTQDDNSALRIAAINILESAKYENNEMHEDILNVLRQKMKTDDNDYIRQRAKAVLKEVRQ